MRRLLVLSTLFALLLGVLGGGVATAREETDGPKKNHAKTLTLFATEASSVFITAGGEVIAEDDEPEVVPGPGARFLVVDTLFDDADRTNEVGRNLIECTFVAAAGETEEDFTANVLCNGVVTLDGQGDLAWQGQFTIPDSFMEEPFVTVALTGGTGAFDRAGGTAAIFDESPEDESETLSRYEISLVRFKAVHRH